MAGKIKKGFGSYLLVLGIALIAAFLIWIAVMLFSPFNTYLGVKHFVYQSADYHYNVLSAEKDSKLDFSTLQEIKINCGYASVEVERSLEVDYHAIKITNKTRGFATQKHDIELSYDITFEDEAKTILKVDVKEPEGFLFLNKSVKVSLLIPAKSAYALDNIKVNISNKTGHIYIGNSGNLSEGSSETKVKSLSLKSKGGDIILFNYANENFHDFLINTNGDVEIRKDIKVANKFELYSVNGDFKFEEIDNSASTTNAVVDVRSAKVLCDSFKGKINLAITSGYLHFGKIDGELISNDVQAQMKSASIIADEVSGVVSLPFANASSIYIDKLASGSQFYANATSGDITIKDANAMVYAITSSGSVNVCTNYTDIEVKTVSGSINVKYLPLTIENQLDFFSEKGRVSLEIDSDLAFILALFNPDGGAREISNKISVEGISNLNNPHTINGGSNKIAITTEGRVNISHI